MLTDNEIKEAAEDSLKFTAFSETLEEIIISSDTPLTIGLYGEWGTGKTSLMRMTQNSLDNNNKIKTTWFDAWKFDKSHDLRVALIQSILREMETNEKEPTFKERVKGLIKSVKEPSFKEKVKDLSKRVNWMGLGMATINQFLIRSMTFKELNEPLIKNTEEISQETLELIGDFEEKFNEIIREYVGNNGKLVVFIDDLDRCIPEKTIDILETIKLFLNVPHSVFVIGADKKVIESGIHHKYPKIFEDWGIKYLDKIIQIPFFLPPLREDVIVEEFIPKLQIRDEIKQYKEIIAEVGGNPRTIKRLINQFELQSILANKQGISVDNKIMAKLSVIQFRQPEFHDTLVEMHVESKTNLVEIIRDIHESDEVDKISKLEDWESLEKYLDDDKFIKFLFEEPLLENIDLDPYVYLVKSTTSSKDEKIDYNAIGKSFAEKREYDEALNSFNKAIELNPDDPVAWSNNGVVLKELGEYDKSLNSYNNAIKLDPNNYRVWCNKGTVLKNLGEYDEALKSFNKAIELNPNDANAWYNRGIVLRYLGEYDESLNSYNKAIKLDPNHANAWNNRGVVLRDLGEYDESLNSYNKAIGLDPNNSKYWYNKGVILNDLGEYEESLNSYNNAIELNPNDAVAWNNKGNVLKGLGEYEESLNCYNNALELDSNNSGYWYNKGVILSDLGEYEESLNSYNKAVELNPNYVDAWYNKGNILKELGDYDKALTSFNRVTELDPNDADAWNDKGNVLKMLNKHKGAKEAYKKAFELDSSLKS